jgi:hypothetical protein
MGILEKLFKDSNPRRLPPPSYSNEAVLARIEKQEGVGRDAARAWFGEMLIFLDLCARSDKVLSPPPDVDKAWHAFLLHSRDYEAYCRDRFGKVIHHQPSGEPDPAAYRRAYDRRQDYGTTTGVGDPLLWTVPANGASEGEDSDDAGARGTASTGAPGGGPYGGGYSDDSSGDRASDGAGGGDSGGSGGGDSGGSSCGGGGCGGGGS